MAKNHGNERRQEVLARKLIKILEDDNPIDQAGALGSAVLTLLFRITQNPREAQEGLEQHCEDMRRSLASFFRERAKIANSLPSSEAKH